MQACYCTMQGSCSTTSGNCSRRRGFPSLTSPNAPAFLPRSISASPSRTRRGRVRRRFGRRPGADCPCRSLVFVPWFAGTKNPASLSRCGVMFNLATSYFRIAFRHTIIGATAFHFRVRNGNGWYHCAMVTRLRLMCAADEAGNEPSVWRHFRECSLTTAYRV